MTTPKYRLHIWPWLQAPCQRWILKDWLAITTFSHIFAWRQLDEAELAHELTHVKQWQANGPLFILRYWMASRKAAGIGGDRYRDNDFEVEAYAAEAAARSRIGSGGGGSG